MSYRARVSSILLLVALGCGGGGTAPSNDTEGGESTNDTGGGESSLAQSTAVGEVAPAHGATLFGVYVVVAEPGAAALEEAAAPLRARSILVSVGELGCDAGAAEALGVAPDQHVGDVRDARGGRRVRGDARLAAGGNRPGHRGLRRLIARFVEGSRDATRASSR